MAPTQNKPVTLIRRLGGIFYDTLLAGSIVFIIAAITLTILTINDLDNIQPDKPLIGSIQPDSPLSHVIFTYYILITFIYFAGFWTHGGQTPAMKIWKMRVENMQGEQINMLESVARFVFALVLPLVSQLWSLFDKEGLALHDRLSQTRLVHLKE